MAPDLLRLFLAFVSLISSLGSHDACTEQVAANCTFAPSNNSTSDEFYFCSDRYSWVWSNDCSSMSTKSSDTTALTMDNSVSGRNDTIVVILGGCEADFQDVNWSCPNVVNETLLYNPEADTFTRGESGPRSRYRFQAVNVTSHIYVFGGRDVNDNLICNVDVYNVVTDVWKTLGVAPYDYCTSDGGGFSDANNTIYLVGGYYADYSTSALTSIVSITYDADGEPSELSYKAGPDLSKGGRGDIGCWMVVELQRAYCIGGYDSNFEVLNRVEELNFVKGVWKRRASMYQARGDFALAYLNGRIIVMGGETTDVRGIKTVEWYDPLEDCWTNSSALFDLPYDRFRFSGAPYVADGRVYVFGGQTTEVNGSYPLSADVFWYQENIVASDP